MICLWLKALFLKSKRKVDISSYHKEILIWQMQIVFSMRAIQIWCFRPNRNSAISPKCIWYKSTFLPNCRFLFYKVWWRSDQSICHLLWSEHFPCKFPTQCFAIVVFDGCSVSYRLQAKAYAKQKQRTDT